jgi:hypothetical protein
MSEFNARNALDQLAAEFRGDQCEIVRQQGRQTILRVKLSGREFDVIATEAGDHCADYQVLTGAGPKTLSYGDPHRARMKLQEIVCTDEPPQDWHWWRTLRRADTGT